MRVFISVDMEGISGVERLEEVFRGQPGYEIFRQIMAGDVNAAAQGAIDAGATDVVVSDSHAFMCNIRPKDVHSEATLRSGLQRAMCQYKGFSNRFDAVFLVGIHAKANTAGAIMPHTWIPAFEDVRVNGESVGEGGLNAYLAGHFGVPVALVTGDDKALEQTKEILGEGPEYVEVKKSTGPSSGVHLPIHESHARIREAAKRALAKNRVTPIPVRHAELPICLELDLADRADDPDNAIVRQNDRFSDFDVDRALSDIGLVASLEDVEVSGPKTVAWTSTSYLEAYNSLFGALQHFYERGLEWLIEEVAKPAAYHRDLSELIEKDTSLNYL